MENIVFERDYSTKSEKCADKSLEPDESSSEQIIQPDNEKEPIVDFQ